MLLCRSFHFRALERYLQDRINCLSKSMWREHSKRRLLTFCSPFKKSRQTFVIPFWWKRLPRIERKRVVMDWQVDSLITAEFLSISFVCPIVSFLFFPLFGRINSLGSVGRQGKGGPQWREGQKTSPAAVSTIYIIPFYVEYMVLLIFTRRWSKNK